MKKSVIILFVLFLFSHCAEYGIFEEGHKAEPPVQTSQEEPPYKIIMVKHPDWNFPATDPNSVVIYEGFMPLDDKFFTIAKIGTIEFGGLYDAEELKRELKLKAAEIGGHALIMEDIKTESKEVGGGITAKSFPQYFWWYYPGEGLKREYTGTEYYAFELPKQTITSYTRIYSVVKFIRKMDNEIRSSFKKALRSGMEETIRKMAKYTGETEETIWERWKATLDILCEDYPFATPKGVFQILAEKIEKGDIKKGDAISFGQGFIQAFKLSQEESVDKIFRIYEQTYKEKYPLADKDEFAMLMMKTDENGEFLYTFEEAMKISHQRKKEVSAAHQTKK